MTSAFRATVSYDDQLGPVQAAANIGSLTIEVYRDTSCLLPFFRHDQDDAISIVFQMTHRKKLGSAIASVHLHYIPMVNPADAAHDDVYFACQYYWTNLNAAIPAVASWTTSNPTFSVGAADEFTNRVFDVATNIAAPASETYSSFFLLYLSRLGTNLNDTYTASKGSGTAQANLCLLGIDLHIQVDRTGSINETSE